MNMNVLMQDLTLRTCQTLQLCKPDPGFDPGLNGGAGNDLRNGLLWHEAENDEATCTWRAAA